MLPISLSIKPPLDAAEFAAKAAPEPPALNASAPLNKAPLAVLPIKPELGKKVAF